MINLLLRFYNPSGGAITIDDVNMQDYNVMSLREGVGYVGQEPVLFRGSVKDNILLGTNDEIDEGAMGQDEESVWSDICLALGVWGSSYTPVHRNAQREEADVELGKIDASLQQVISAAQAAHAHDFITSFPQGYDTVLSNGGGELSGGQKQR
ncbi:ATP-binding cassette domain-containing protein, partial [archaeon]